MNEIPCPYRSITADQVLVCQIVSDLTHLPLELCETNHSACAHCFASGVAPQTPNLATASMGATALRKAQRPPDPRFVRVLSMPPAVPLMTVENTPCILRGRQIREQACKPCQAGSRVPVWVPVYQCSLHGECTLRATGTHPRIQACSTCLQRQPEAPQPQSQFSPSEILAVLTMAVDSQSQHQATSHHAATKTDPEIHALPWRYLDPHDSGGKSPYDLPR